MSKFPKKAITYRHKIATIFRPHSLMDKMEDSGSFDYGSIPYEGTNKLP